ncbi:MAG: DUF4258 domain-containing protein [Dehalococcoidia bacterium]|nr:DUF4258 domain-containing protein [Dehalococcoidia bacterium]
MSRRRITEDMVRETLDNPHRKGAGYKNRLLAFKAFDRGTVKVVYRMDGDTAVVISVMWD